MSLSKRLLFFGYLLMASAFAHSAPGVWEQMQTGTITSVRGVVKSVDIEGSEIYFRVEVKDAFGDKEERSDRLCRSADGSEDLRESEEVRAALLRSKIDLLQEARRSGRLIEYGSQGPWKSCVNFLRLFNS